MASGSGLESLYTWQRGIGYSWGGLMVIINHIPLPFLSPESIEKFDTEVRYFKMAALLLIVLFGRPSLNVHLLVIPYRAQQTKFMNLGLNWAGQQLQVEEISGDVENVPILSQNWEMGCRKGVGPPWAILYVRSPNFSPVLWSGFWRIRRKGKNCFFICLPKTCKPFSPAGNMKRKT